MMTKQKTLEDIKETFGFVPGFFEDFKWDDLALSGGWELFKKFELSETNIPLKWKHLIALAAANAIRCVHFSGIFRSEEHTAELLSRQYLVCRPILQKQNGS